MWCYQQVMAILLLLNLVLCLLFIYGVDYSLRVNLNEAYSNSVITVKSNGTTLNSVDVVYSIGNIRGNQTVTITGTVINKYTNFMNE